VIKWSLRHKNKSLKNRLKIPPLEKESKEDKP